MKAPNFAYEKPSTLREAIDVLTRHNGTAVPIAGGQSLLAGLSMRLSSPEVIVDLAGLSELKGISIEGNFVRVGALTRHVELLRSPQIRDHVPLIAKAIQFVAHVAVRNRGTIGGSVALRIRPPNFPPALSRSARLW
jgi:aerobic carbon-monoxide dehydrogenase medium subunit